MNSRLRTIVTVNPGGERPVGLAVHELVAAVQGPEVLRLLLTPDEADGLADDLHRAATLARTQPRKTNGRRHQ